MNFWDRFVELCEKNNTKPNPLSKELGISSGLMTKWKNGFVPNTDALIKISQRFNVSIDYLLGNNGDIINTDNAIVGNNNQMNCNNNKDFFNNTAVNDAYDKLSEKSKLEVQIFILDKAEKEKK